MKAKTLLVAAVMFFGLTAAAFAQATYTVSSTPVTTVTKTGMTEKTGDITFTPIDAVQVAKLGTISVSYGVPITNSVAGATPGIAVVNPVTRAAVPTVASVASVDNLHGIVVINVFDGNPAVVFTLTGVRVQISGTSVTQVNAQISAVNNYIVSGQTNPTVITAVGDGLVMGTGTAGVINQLTGATTTQPIIKLKEGYLNAFGVAAVANDQTNGIVIRLTLSAAPPTGYSIVFPATAQTDATTPATFTTATVTEDSSGNTTAVTNSNAAVTITSSSTALKIYYQLTSNSDPTKLETLSIPLTLTYDTTKGLPVPQATITYTATLYPIGIGLTSAGAVPSPALVPRYSVAEVGPGSLIGALTGANQTNILIPYVARVAVSGWDTGIAISNTTSDPGSTVLGFSGAVPQIGTIKFYFYNSGSATANPTSFTYTTAAGSPGTGLNANGQLPAGATYSVTLSQLVKAAQGVDLDFSGYVIAVTGFGNAHCQYLLTDFTHVANGGQGMIIGSIRSTPEALNH